MRTESIDDHVTRASIFAALGDPGRLAIVDRLASGDASPSEIAQLLSIPSNLVAHHLRVLETAGLVRRLRSEGDRRRTYLSINRNAHAAAMAPSGTQRAARVLFVCTRNSARSQLAVAVWHRHSAIPATSAGTHPDDEDQRGLVAAAKRRDLPLTPRAPRHLDDVLAPDDLVIALCDKAHEELPTTLARMHWSIPDPARTSRAEAFDRTIDELTHRIGRFAPRLTPV